MSAFHLRDQSIPKPIPRRSVVRRAQQRRRPGEPETGAPTTGNTGTADPTAANEPKGAVLIDVLTGMTFVLLLVGAAQTWARAVLFTQKVLETSATAQEEAGLAIDALARDVRNAGFDANGAVSPIAVATRESLELVADLNGDGDIDDANERVRYAYRADRRQVTRASGRGSPQPFADDVPAGGLSFVFWDESGGEIAGVNEAELSRVRRVDVRLKIETSNPDPRAADPIRAEAFTVVALRNR